MYKVKVEYRNNARQALAGWGLSIVSFSSHYSRRVGNPQPHLTRCAELRTCTSQLATTNALRMADKKIVFSIKTLPQTLAMYDLELCRLS